MNPLDPNSIVGKIALSWIRHSLSGIVGWFVGSGLWNANQADQGITAAMTLIVLFLSAYDKYKQKPPSPPGPSVPI